MHEIEYRVFNTDVESMHMLAIGNIPQVTAVDGIL